MKNLRILGDERLPLEVAVKGKVSFTAADIHSKKIYVLVNDSFICQHEGADWQVDLQEHVDWNEFTRVTSLSFVIELDALCLTTSAGHLLTISTIDKAIEEIGQLEGGIVSADWSPDGELLAVITGSAVLLLFTLEFEVVSEISLYTWPERIVPTRALPQQEASDTCCKAYLSWRGDAKYFVTVTQESKDGQALLRVWTKEGCLLHALGESVSGLLGPVSWQPNGRHIYAVHRINDEVTVCLYETNGLAHGQFSLRTKGHVKFLGWSHDSELLAAQISQPNNEGSPLQIVQIWLRSNWKWYLKQELHYQDCNDLEVNWDEEDASLLHIVTENGMIQHVKLHSCVDVSSLGTVAVVDGQDLLITPLRQTIIPPPMCAVKATFPSTIKCLAFSQTEDEKILVILSDGSAALLRSEEEDFWDPLDDTISDYQNEGRTGVSRVASIGQPSQSSVPDLIKPYIFPSVGDVSQSDLCNARLAIWTKPESFSVICTDFCTERQQKRSQPILGEFLQRADDKLLNLDILDSSERGPILELKGTEPLRNGVLTAHSLEDGKVCMQDSSGKIFRGKQTFGPPETFLEPCPFTCICPNQSQEILGLTKNGNILHRQRIVASNVGSMTLRHGKDGKPNYLLYITKDNLLHTSPLENVLEPPIALESNGENKLLAKNILQARVVEKGATLITSPPEESVVVLQMPRGNLEAIYPRSLVLPAIAELIQADEYGEAFQMAISHRVDVNLIVDYQWPKFLVKASLFVREVPDDQDLVDLLSALNEQNITSSEGLYAGLPNAVQTEIGHAQPQGNMGKVSLVCNAMREAMLSSDSALYLKPIVTSFAIQDKLEDALQLIKDTKEMQLANEGARNDLSSISGQNGFAGQGDLGKHRKAGYREPPSAEDALTFLLLTVDVEKVYRAALGMYELELAYMVIVHGQRDPGEYLIELRSFASKEEGPLRKYAINLHLGRIPEALNNLLDAGDTHFEKALDLAKTEGRLREFLRNIDERGISTARRKQSLNTYGAWLSERQMKEDAAVAFMGAENLAEALIAYKSANQWSMALSLAVRLGYSKQNITSLAEELVESLTASSQWREAAQVASQYLSDADSAVSLLSQAHCWREALRLATFYQREDLLETTVIPAAAETSANLLEELSETIDSIQKYSTRLQDIRQKRKAMTMMMEAEGSNLREDFDDTNSEAASTMVSGMSAYTRGTESQTTGTQSLGVPSTIGGRLPEKKQRRNKKGARIRQGSPQEEEALVAHIASLAPSDSRLQEVGELNEFLILLGLETDARKLQNLLSQVVLKQQEAADSAKAEEENQGKNVNESESKSSESKLTIPQRKPVETVKWKWDILRA